MFRVCTTNPYILVTIFPFFLNLFLSFLYQIEHKEIETGTQTESERERDTYRLASLFVKLPFCSWRAGTQPQILKYDNICAQLCVPHTGPFFVLCIKNNLHLYTLYKLSYSKAISTFQCHLPFPS